MTFPLADEIARDCPDDLPPVAATNTVIVANRCPTVLGLSIVTSKAAGVYSPRYGSKAARR
jgi:hypothetical protein